MQVVYEGKTQKQLAKIPARDRIRLMDRIDAYAADQNAGDVVKLQGTENTFRLRSGNYRAIFDLDAEADTMTITRVGHRKDVY